MKAYTLKTCCFKKNTGLGVHVFTDGSGVTDRKNTVIGVYSKLFQPAAPAGELTSDGSIMREKSQHLDWLVRKK